MCAAATGGCVTQRRDPAIPAKSNQCSNLTKTLRRLRGHVPSESSADLSLAAERTRSMRTIARSSFALGLAAAIALFASAAADAQAYGPGYGPFGYSGRYGTYRGGAYGTYPGGAYDAVPGGAYDAVPGGAYDAVPGGAYDAYRGSPESYSGTSVPYDASGPGWNDFQLQGR
jgi:hypothetical protein